MFGKKKREQTDKMVSEEFVEIKRACDSLYEKIEKAKPHFDEYLIYPGLGKESALESRIEELAKSLHRDGITIQQLPFEKVMGTLLTYYGSQLPFTYGDLKSLATYGLGCEQKVGWYLSRYVYNYTKKEADKWIKSWQEMQPHFQTLMDVCEEFNYNKYDGEFHPAAGDAKRCALVEKSLRETFEGLLGKDIEKRVERLAQNEEKERTFRQKDAEEPNAKEKKERTERINAQFGIGKGGK